MRTDNGVAMMVSAIIGRGTVRWAMALVATLAASTMAAERVGLALDCGPSEDVIVPLALVERTVDGAPQADLTPFAAAEYTLDVGNNTVYLRSALDGQSWQYLFSYRPEI
jgi:hypothetical protein